MTWITIDNVQRVVTPKEDNLELWFLCFANCIMVIYIFIKFKENISNSFQVTEWTQIVYRNHYFQSSNGHNSKSRLTRDTVLWFITSCHDALHLLEVSWNYLEQFLTYRMDTPQSNLLFYWPHPGFVQVFRKTGMRNKCRLRSDTTECNSWSGSNCLPPIQQFTDTWIGSEMDLLNFLGQVE